MTHKGSNCKAGKYVTRRDAYEAMMRYQAEWRTSQMNTYQCRRCRQWHFGHVPGWHLANPSAFSAPPVSREAQK